MRIRRERRQTTRRLRSWLNEPLIEETQGPLLIFTLSACGRKVADYIWRSDENFMPSLRFIREDHKIFSQRFLREWGSRAKGRREFESFKTVPGE